MLENPGMCSNVFRNRHMITKYALDFYSLMLRFTEDDFDSDQALTIGVDFKTKVINIDGVNVKLGETKKKQ